MSQETYRQFFLPSEDIVLRDGQSTEITFSLTEDESEKEQRLFFTGETTLFYFWKNEPDCTAQYYSIEDALDNQKAQYAPYALNLTNKREVNYPKVTFKKIIFPPVLSYLGLHSYDDDWKVGVKARADSLIMTRPDGYIRMTYEAFFRKEGLPEKATCGEPDIIEHLDIPVGSYNWVELSRNLVLPKDRMGSLMVYVEALGYTGELLLESPFVTSSNGYNVLPDFLPPYLAHDNHSWLGHNLSRKEWPSFALSLNGKEFYRGELFERAHRYSECEINLPYGIVKAGENRLHISYIPDYPDPLPYRIHEIGIFSKPHELLQIVALPESATANRSVCLLVKAQKPIIVHMDCPGNQIQGNDICLSGGRLEVLEYATGEPSNDVDFILSAEGETHSLTLKRILLREDDHVVTGSGDLIYVNQESRDDFEEYISWYLGNHIGNLMTIRPAYRWSGGRVLNSENWAYLKELLNGYHIRYVHMTDGREFPGGTANPPCELLAGEGFYGRQAHEFDGSYMYWGHNESTVFTEASADYWNRLTRLYPETVNPRYSKNAFNRDTGKMYPYVDATTIPHDMELAAKELVNNLRDSRFGQLRHTGPSVCFKYFYQAGYQWTGIESMYGPLELLSAFLRGAAHAYGNDIIGSHLAVQWSTTPHDQPERYRRYRASLYSSYIQGIHDINTEEGFWHLEEYYNYFHRESDACRSHKAQQQDFYRFVSTHSRRGRFYTPMAFIYGRYDGFRSFVNDRIFGAEGLDSADPEYSWDLLSEFYVLEKANGGFYLHPCPTDHEPGMLTGTPRGNVDVIPMETDVNHMKNYRCLAFLGYNKALPEDMDKLLSFVSNGGTLLVGWPHLSETTDRQDILNEKHRIISHRLTEFMTSDRSAFISDEYNGQKLLINDSLCLDHALVLKTTDSGAPLLLDYSVGNGHILLVNALEYPAHSALEGLYRQAIRNISDSLNAMEDCFISCGDDLQFTVYDNEDRREIYLMAMDWFRDPALPRHATLRIKSQNYPISLPFGVLYKIVYMDETAAYVDTEDAEVLSVSKEFVTVQGHGTATLYVANNGRSKAYPLDFSEQAILRVLL